MQKIEHYTGVDNLEVMREAHNYNRFLLSTVRRYAKASARIIDFGAGTGEFALPLVALGCNVTAVEPDDLMQRRLREGGMQAVSSPRELADQSFDYVYTLNVLEHVENDVAALRELYVKLAAQGTILIYVPAFPLLYTSMDAKVGHMRRYTRRTLIAAVRAAGFDVGHVAYVDSIGFFAALLFKFVGNKDGDVSVAALKLYDRVVFPLSRALDLLVQRWFGKNLLLVAHKAPDAQ